MAHKLNKLTARTVATANRAGLYADGGGLYLRVGRGGAKSWCLRFMLNGKSREMGLGGLAKVGLADARKRAAAQRLLLVDKIDPLERREIENSAKKVAVARSITPMPELLQNYASVTTERLKKLEDGNWLMFRRTYDGWGYSPLAGRSADVP